MTTPSIEAALKDLIKRLDGELPNFTGADTCVMCGTRTGSCPANCPTEMARAALLEVHLCTCGAAGSEPHFKPCPVSGAIDP